MKILRLIAVAALVLLMGTPSVMAQRGRGGMVRGGARGAMVGGLLGGSEGAQAGKKIGAVAGGVRRADYRADQRALGAETQARAAYLSSEEYYSSPHSNFYESQPTVIVVPN